jgi:hypothetical protein
MDLLAESVFYFFFVKKEKGKEIYKSNGKYKQLSLKEKRSVRSAGTNPTLRDIVFLFGLHLFHRMRNDSAGSLGLQGTIGRIVPSTGVPFIGPFSYTIKWVAVTVIQLIHPNLRPPTPAKALIFCARIFCDAGLYTPDVTKVSILKKSHNKTTKYQRISVLFLGEGMKSVRIHQACDYHFKTRTQMEEVLLGILFFLCQLSC